MLLFLRFLLVKNDTDLPRVAWDKGKETSKKWTFHTGTALLGYLDRVATDAGLPPGLIPGLVEPWERGTLRDGTKHSLDGAGPRKSWKDDV